MTESIDLASPELRVLLACSRVSLEPEARRSLDATLEGPVDWSEVMRLARWHGVRPLLQRHLAESPRVPREVRLELWSEGEAIARRNRTMQSELFRIEALLRADRVRALPYKGPRLASALYGDVALREFGDLDILVPKAEVLVAKQVLLRAGYSPEYALSPAIERAFLESDAQYHLVMRSRESGLVVELHWKTDPDFPVEGDGAWWEAKAVDGPAFTPEELALLLCIHGSKHFWSSLGWLVDVAEMTRPCVRVDWSAVAQRAIAMGCSRRVGLGLRLAAEMLGAPLAGAARDLAMQPEVDRLAAKVSAMLLPEPRLPGAFEGTLLHWRLHERAGHRLRGVVNAVWSPSLVEWTRWPLPKPLFFLYPFLRLARLAAKYAARPFQSAFARRRLQP